MNAIKENNNDIFQNFITKNVFQHYSNGFDALQKNEFISAAVWGCVFLEAFLDEVLDKFNISKPDKKELNSYIQRMKNVSDPGLDDIIKRCDQIRIIRNRLVHNTGLAKETLQDDANSIFTNLDFILKWYCRKIAPLEEIKETVEENQPNTEDLIPVFISTITPDNERQRFFIYGFTEKLKKIGILPVKCEFNFYDKKDPLSAVKREISRCKAMIVIGLERSNAYYIKDKEGSEKEKMQTHRKYTSGWLHLEAGMADALDKEVFVICQKDLYSDGIFDRMWNSYPVLEFSDLNEDSRELRMFFDYMKNWAKLNKELEEKEENQLQL